MKKITKGDIIPFNGIILEKKEYEKLKQDSEILDKIDAMFRKNGKIMFEKNT